jgi:hypothetical protein
MCTRAPSPSGTPCSEDEYEPESGTLFHYEFMRIGEDYEDIVYDRSVDSDMILGVDRNAYVNV